MLSRVSKLLGFEVRSPDNQDDLVYFHRGTTVPADGTDGYGTGCIFQHTDGGNGTSFYVNEGTGTNADFNLLLISSTAEITTAMLADDAVTAAKVADAAIDAAAKIGGGVVTPPKLIGTGVFAGHFVGRNLTGAITLTGAVIGQRVFIGWKSGDASDHNTAGEGSVGSLATFTTLFEAAITVTDQIQQASNTDLSDNKYTVILLPAAS